MSLVLGIDPGFAAMGWAVVDPATMHCKAVGLIRTAKDKRKVLATADNVKRGRELLVGLAAVLDRWNVAAIASESMSWPRNAGVTGKMGIAWGVIIAVAEIHGLPLVTVSPQDLKRAATGRKNASKTDVFCAATGVGSPLGVAGVVPGLLTRLDDSGIPEGKWEHPVDAACAVYATRESDVMRALQRGGAT